MSEADAAEKAIAATLKRLDVAPDGPQRFVGSSGQVGPPRLFGGLVAGQAMVAAARSANALTPHSLHAYFLQPGRPGEPIVYRVQSLKEGRNFHARQVLAEQGERIIFSMQASFWRPGEGVEHQAPMPEAPAPQTLRGGRFGFGPIVSPIEMRDCDPDWERAAERGLRRVWIRPAAPLGEDPVLHLAFTVFASDMSLVMTGILPHPELRRRPRGGASLDHAMWFHQAPRLDDWVLYTMWTPAAHAARPLVQGAMYGRDGTRIVSVCQEGLIRTRSAGG